jgi:hypothetical protein
MARPLALGVVAVGTLATLAGCGFVAAGNKSPSKPSAFVLNGHAAVTLLASSQTIGSTCVSPTGATDVAANVTVTVTDASGGGAGGGKKIATGTLGVGVITSDSGVAACSFPFQIRGVPGGIETYGVAIGTRPAQIFPGDALRSSTPAVITIIPGA